MTSTLEKYSQQQQIQQQQSATRSFCPLILYHDRPSKELSINLNANKHNNRTAIDRHRDKTNEMLEHNAQFWSEKSGLVDDEADYSDKDIKVSPSTSTTSNISSSSSSSGESIATIDMQGQQHHNIRSPVIQTSLSNHGHVGLYYNNNKEEEEEDEKEYYPLLLSKPTKVTTIPSVDATKKRRRGNLPKEVTEFLRKWLIQHKKHPYPAEKEKADLARHTGLTVNQISNWFINARRRILQPMLESENLTAQMMAYPDLVPSSSSSGNPSFEPPRRRRHDFYTYQRDFASRKSHISLSFSLMLTIKYNFSCISAHAASPGTPSSLLHSTHR
ncbi:uncharacterized protein EV154DRAFT_492190 [Mucor mucedo]|uniref:uncharacterized protein n=1 Tax=Mucor mucedo TaxID=29922 RepID=UPI00221EABBB|nr:uncharacterized protein EV154DRAFT_492190 [Mucor mucedo]KAI7896425.1 hypothetical protein EV154DRAFT_492190 [Mucor mucedo]